MTFKELLQSAWENPPLPVSLKDEGTLSLNKLRAKMFMPSRVACIGPASGTNAIVYYLDEREEEILFVFHHDGNNLCLLLKQNTEFPLGNRKQLVEMGCTFLFANTDGDPVSWPFYKDITKDGVNLPFDLQTPDPITGLCTETPFNAVRGRNLLATVAIYFTADQEVNQLEFGNYIALLELGDKSSEDGGMIRLYQGREIPIDDIEIV